MTWTCRAQVILTVAYCLRIWLSFYVTTRPTLKQTDPPLRWLNTSGLNRFGFPWAGISKWLGVSCCCVMAVLGPRRVVVADEGVQRSLKFCFESDIVIVEWAGPEWPPPPPPLLFPTPSPPPPPPPPRPLASVKAPPPNDNYQLRITD